MTTTLGTSTGSASPRKAALDRSVAMSLAEHEYARFLTTLRQLEPADWARPTACAGWDVRALASHVLGMAEMAGSTREQGVQMLPAWRRAGVFIDNLTAIQVAKHAGDPPERIVASFAAAAPAAARGRRRVPSLLLKARIPIKQAVGGQLESWSMGFLMDVVLTRDTWMHRLDIAAAVGSVPELTPDHDGVIVADVVAEWAGRHGQPCELLLTGPAGGTWTFAGGGPVVQCDAVEFCRLLSGRGTGEGLLGVQVPF
jgi:uncharacterized protein (TIGR03083 family)